MAQKVKAWAALPEDPGLITSTHMEAHNHQAHNELFWPPEAPGIHGTQLYVQKN